MARSSDRNFLGALLRDKTFQAREIRRVIKLSAIYLLVTTVLVGVFYHQMLGRLLEGMAPLLFVSEDSALVNEALPSMTTVLAQWVLIMLGVNLLITVSLGIYITRKLGHPILALRRALREIGSGNLDVRLRSTDSKDFGEISTELNLAMFSIRTQIAAAKSGMNKMTLLHEQPASNRHAADVDHALTDCHSALDFFQTDDNSGEFTLLEIDDGDKGTSRVA